jgi:NTP pyrophosphatase (non-canonical NTP hydrolase)
LVVGKKKMHINEFQNMMRRIYFRRDSERGTDGTLDWLEDEVEELKEALKEKDTTAIENEFADVLAWLASLANVANIDLEKAALSKYDNKCPKCGLSSCECPF